MADDQDSQPTVPPISRHGVIPAAGGAALLAAGRTDRFASSSGQGGGVAGTRPANGAAGEFHQIGLPVANGEYPTAALVTNS